MPKSKDELATGMHKLMQIGADEKFGGGNKLGQVGGYGVGAKIGMMAVAHSAVIFTLGKSKTMDGAEVDTVSVALISNHPYVAWQTHDPTGRHYHQEALFLFLLFSSFLFFYSIGRGVECTGLPSLYYPLVTSTFSFFVFFLLLLFMSNSLLICLFIFLFPFFVFFTNRYETKEKPYILKFVTLHTHNCGPIDGISTLKDKKALFAQIGELDATLNEHFLQRWQGTLDERDEGFGTTVFLIGISNERHSSKA